MKNIALVVLSGGQDSTTCLLMALRAGHDEVHAISFDYGQRHVVELEAARNVGLLCRVASHEFVKLGSGIMQGTSPLTDPSQHLEQYKDAAEMEAIIGDRVEKTFVPMRNALFLNIAANRAVCLGATSIYTGVCEADNANYPDCRYAFIRVQEITINEALGYSTPFDPHAIKLVTPLMTMSKAESILKMQEIGGLPLLAFTHTAYDGQYPPVGNDHATLLRADGFVKAGCPDPLVVRAVMAGLMPLPSTPNYSLQYGSPFWHNLVDDINMGMRELSRTGGHPPKALEASL